jgi:ribosome-associated protein
MIRINSRLSIPDDEISFTFSRSSGPGGQNVNKLNTRVTLLFDVARSSSLSDTHRERILDRLATRISRGGILRVVSQKHRTQKMNRQAATERFAELLQDALTPRRRRKKTTVPAAVRKKRLDDKKRRSRLKGCRKKPSAADDL